jgi:hypothetical protein
MFMQKITIYLALLFLLVSTRVSAQLPEAIQLHNASGTTQSVSLVTIQYITFENDVMVLATSEGTFRLSLNDVEYISFGKDSSVTTAV